MIKNKKVSVILPVYNEEKTIGNLVKALLSFPCVDQIVCVDDGSKDQTYQELLKFKDQITLIHYAKNKGKGYALSKGLENSRGEIIVFCDSDLVGLSENDLKKLTLPLFTKKVKMVLGHPWGTKLFGIYAKSLTGERAFFKKDLLPLTSNFKNSRFGVETYLNSVFKKWVNVNLGCRHLEKFEKYSSKEAVTSYIKEGLEIVRQRAKIEGLWSDEIEQQLLKLSRFKTWQTLIQQVSQIKNTRLKTILKKYLKKYVLSYAQRLKSLLTD